MKGGTMKTRLRTLRVGPREFRWTAELCGFYDIERNYHRCVRVRVWGGGKNGCTLRADLESTSPGPWGGVPDSSYPTPRIVRAIVDYALNHGWDPAVVGGRPHELGTDAGVELPGFRITNRLRSMQHLRS
jgi:hypothetical protein